MVLKNFNIYITLSAEEYLIFFFIFSLVIVTLVLKKESGTYYKGLLYFVVFL